MHGRLSTLGTLGNVLVIAVYARNMTTSTRYICLRWPSLTRFWNSPNRGAGFTTVGGTAPSIGHNVDVFSVLLPAFLSTDRLKAVARPHTFSFNASGAKMVFFHCCCFSHHYMLKSSFSNNVEFQRRSCRVFPKPTGRHLNSTEQHILQSQDVYKSDYKGMTLLFTITAVFIACWMPLWPSLSGVYVPKNLRGTFFFNSSINPFT